MKAVGVDGCKGGWVAMVWDMRRGEILPEIHPTLADLLAKHEDAGAVGIDIPIGLSNTGTRKCDVEARKLLGPGRASSVFPPPIYDVLDAHSHAEAVIKSKALIDKGVSIQAFSIFDKIKEANDTIEPSMQDRVFEVHPEVSFSVLAGHPMANAKDLPEGYQERRALLEQEMDIVLPDRKEAFKWARPAKPDDLLDATVAAWTAQGVAQGHLGRLPATPENGTKGLRMEIVYGRERSDVARDDTQAELEIGQPVNRFTDWSVPGNLQFLGRKCPVCGRVLTNEKFREGQPADRWALCRDCDTPDNRRIHHS